MTRVVYTTIEFKIYLMRGITTQTGQVTEEGNIVRVGKRTGLAEGVVRDANNWVLVKGTATV